MTRASAVLRRVWPVLPDQVLGVDVPRRFRGLGVRCADADRVLVEFAAWLEGARRGATVAPDSAVGERDASRASAERLLLISTCIDLRDRLAHTSPALDRTLRSALERVGVLEVSADGERFDEQRHNAVERAWTDDVELSGSVASTDRVGYADGEHLLREPDVVVYRLRTQASAEETR